jgi:glycosyltransferase involved in cell wall biosynthesis
MVADNAVDRNGTTPRLTVVVPALNEEHRLPATLAGLTDALGRLALASEIVVVDNGSTDRTGKVARAHRHESVAVRVLWCPRRGKGAAVRAGVLASGGAYVGFCDADLATSTDALIPTLAYLGAGVNVVVGSRAHPDSYVWAPHGVVRRTGAWAFRRAVQRLVPGIRDTQCGYKFFDRRTATALFRPLRTPGFAFDVELLARAQRAGAVIAELPVRWADRPGSSFSPARDGLRSFATLYRLRTLLDGEAVPAMATRSVPALDMMEAAEIA